MTKTFSLYLDLVRFTAACLVLIYHSNQRWVVEAILPASNYGHSSVIVFFVLSGFVISYITRERENTLPEYTASRVARIYSVTLPAVILTPLLDYLGKHISAAAYEGSAPDDWPIIRGGASLTFTNELWWNSIMSFSNTPYWSLCYEVWYYVAFGVWIFSRPGLRPWLLCGVALIVGPKILLLAPIWFMGVLLDRWNRLNAWKEGTGWALLLASIVGIVAFHRADVTALCTNWLRSIIGPYWHRELAFSKFFIGDYLLGTLVMIHFGGVRAVAHRLRAVLDPWSKLIRGLAAYTFTLYVLHVPLFLFWGTVIRGDPKRPWFYLTTIALVGISVFVVGFVTENKRQGLRAFLVAAFSRPFAFPWTRKSAP
jgi:peptidoglycan/LPS O-acetylase OafA/YrhL